LIPNRNVADPGGPLHPSRNPNIPRRPEGPRCVLHPRERSGARRAGALPSPAGLLPPHAMPPFCRHGIVPCRSIPPADALRVTCARSTRFRPEPEHSILRPWIRGGTRNLKKQNKRIKHKGPRPPPPRGSTSDSWPCHRRDRRGPGGSENRFRTDVPILRHALPGQTRFPAENPVGSMICVSGRLRWKLFLSTGRVSPGESDWTCTTER